MPQRVQSLRSSVKSARPAGGSREPGEIYTNYADKQLGVIDAAKAPQDLLAVRFFSTAADYLAGDFVINAGIGYKAKVNVTAGAFNPTQWDTVSTGTTSEPPIAPGTTAQYWRGDKIWATLDKTAVGLGNVDNTSDAGKPISGPTQAALNLKAPIASPTFTGTVIAPTPSAGTNNTTVATTAFVATSFAPILDPFFAGNPQGPTPATADNDTSLATTAYVKNNLASYAPLSSPVFTGNPVAPTPSPGDSDTSIATTAFVQDAIGNRPTDAPSDANSYGRKAGAWVDVTEEAPNDGVSYGRKSGSWVASVGGAVISDTPPPGPLTPGQLWYEADSGNTFLWYSDADSSQWVQQNIQPAIASNPLAGLTAETKSRVVNGAFQISQENSNTAGATYGYYPADQFNVYSVATTAVWNVFRAQVETPNGSQNRLRLTVTTADAAMAAGDILWMQTVVEGIRVADFSYGAAGAKQAILRFGWKGAPGTYSVAIRNSAANRSWVTSFTTTANADAMQTIIIPGDVTGTWLKDTGQGLQISWAVMCGTTYQTAPGVWTVGNFMGASTQTNGAAAIQAWELYDVALYLDPLNTGVAPRWAMPDEAQELQACQRYWEQGQEGMDGSSSAASVAWSAYSSFKTTKRAIPAMSSVNQVNSNVGATSTLDLVTAAQFRAYRTAAAATGFAWRSIWTANARM